MPEQYTGLDPPRSGSVEPGAGHEPDEEPRECHTGCETLDEVVRQAGVYEPAKNLPTGWRLLSDVDSLDGDGPPVVVRSLAWRGRVTLLHAREKAGKSTLMGAAAAAVTRAAAFLEAPTCAGPVVWFGEEHPSDAKTRMEHWGADCRRIAFGNHLTREPDGGKPSLQAIVACVKPVLVVVDTLALYASALGIRDLNSAGELGPVMADLAALARRIDAAIVVLHHNKKNTSNGTPQGEYRDSTAIAAVADMIVSLDEQGGAAENARRLTLKGRWSEPPLVVTLGEDGYSVDTEVASVEPAPAPRPLRERVLLHLLRCAPAARPSRTEIRQALNCEGRRYTELIAALDSLVDVGEVDHAKREGKRGEGYALTSSGRPAAEALRAKCSRSTPGGGTRNIS